TTLSEDDVIARICEGVVPCFRGHPTDLLDRHYRTAAIFGARHVVKIPSDCPLIDPDVVDRVIGAYLEKPGAFDYVSNLHPESYPDGNDVEVFSFEALGIAWLEAREDYEREHTTPFFWDTPGRFRLGNVAWETGLDLSRSHRWTVDYREDYEAVRSVFDALYPGNPRFRIADVLELYRRRPHLSRINARYCGVNWYRHHLSKLKTVSRRDTREPAPLGGAP